MRGPRNCFLSSVTVAGMAIMALDPIRSGSVFTILRLIREDDKGVNCLHG